MTGLWTPAGDNQPAPRPQDDSSGAGPAGRTGGDPDAGPDLAELALLRDQLLATPVATIIANHAIGMWELAALHLGLTGGPEDVAPVPPDLSQARLALDAVAALVEGLGARLGEHQPVLADALSQLRLAYVQVSELVARGGGVTGPDSDGS